MRRATNFKTHSARVKKDDEFYTPRAMIEAELAHYSKTLFKGKRILCNCDDPDQSHFFRYFSDNFTALKLKRLVGIRFSGSALPYLDVGKEAARYQEPPDDETPTYKRELFADKNGKKHCTGRRFLRGDSGGFDDREGRRQLAACDIVVTNPPFSKFKEFMKLMAQSGKKFLVIGNLNGLSYKEIFPLIQSGKIWLGVARCKGDFVRPKGSKPASAPTLWFTNLPHDRRERGEIPLTSEYKASTYPAYENYAAIEVSATADIPAGYDGEMGVPVTFLEKHNPRQFEIIWTTDRGGDGMLEHLKKPHIRHDAAVVRGDAKYKRIIIRRTGAAAADWKETKDLERHSTFGNAGGFVYVAVIPGAPGWFKIGKTTTSVNERVKREAFSPEKPKVVMALEVANAGMAEKQIHDVLRQYRKKGTEFFNPPRKELEQELGRLAQKPIRLWR